MNINQFVGKYWNILDDKTKQKIKEIKDPVQQLHSILFGEETDYISDSTSDAHDRKNGINPMSEEYMTKVNSKRNALGVTPLNNVGLSTDNSTMELCKKIIEDTYK